MCRALPVALALLLGLLATAALAHGAAPANAGQHDEVEMVDVQEVAPAAATPGKASLLDLAGRMHPAIVHLPIGWLLLVTLWEIGTALLRRRELDVVGRYLVLGAFLVFPPAAVTGFLRAMALPHDAATRRLIEIHRNAMIATAVVVLCAVLVRWLWRRDPLAGRRRLLYLGLLVAATILVTVGGDVGGRLVYGFGLLPF